MSRPFESHSSRRVLLPGIVDQDLLSRGPRHLRYVPFSCVHLLLRSIHDSPHRTSIHILDDDSLIHIFHHCRPVLFDNEQDEIEMRLTEGEEWLSERWWYKVAQVCRRWRYIILGSASHLRLSLVCTHGTPVVDMLAQSPPLPLIIDHLDEIHDISDEDVNDILLLLQHRDRIRRIRLRVDIPFLHNLIKAIDGEFPMLEYLYIGIPANGNARLVLPKRFQAPRLQHLILDVARYHIGSPLLTTAIGIVTLLLGPIVPLHLPPKDLLVSLALLSQLEILGVGFLPPVLSGDSLKWQELLHRPITSHVRDVTLPNLRWFMFSGLSEYLEALLPHVTTPLLEGFRTLFVHQLNITIIRLHQITTVAAKHRFSCATLTIEEHSVSISVNPPKWKRMDTFYMKVDSRRIDLQLASLVQIVNELRTIFYAVEYLTLKYRKNSIASDRHNEANRAKWRELLRPFSSVKTLRLRMPKRLVVAFSHSLQLRDGESPMELLPELKELKYPENRVAGNTFSSFADSRRNAGHPFALVPC